MYKFLITPNSSNYVIDQMRSTIAANNDYGYIGVKLNKKRIVKTIDAEWLFDKEQYEYFRAFVNLYLNKGILPFYLDLIISGVILNQQIVYFVPDTITLSNLSENAFTVTARLEIKPEIKDKNSDIAKSNAFGTPASLLSRNDIIYNLNLLEQLSNYDIAV